jgi:hypothetical protein
MATATPETHARAQGDKREIKIVQHSQLFYWWPVWAIGVIMGLITLWDGKRLAVLPSTTKIEQVKATADETRPDYVLTVPGKAATNSVRKAFEDKEFKVHMADSKNLGVIFCFTLLLVVLITNVPLRGMWSFVVILALVFGIVIISLIEGAWEMLGGWIGLLDIHINMGAYFFISTVLFIIWLVTLYIFDKQVYIVFTPGQMKVREEIGGGEASYSTVGMVIRKQRDDLFRHWILGLGSGDLIVRTAGAQSHEFHLSNVLFIGHKLKMIEDMQREVAVVSGNP